MAVSTGLPRATKSGLLVSARRQVAVTRERHPYLPSSSLFDEEKLYVRSFYWLNMLFCVSIIRANDGDRWPTHPHSDVFMNDRMRRRDRISCAEVT
jgi:hypothetical protein